MNLLLSISAVVVLCIILVLCLVGAMDPFRSPAVRMVLALCIVTCAVAMVSVVVADVRSVDAKKEACRDAGGVPVERQGGDRIRCIRGEEINP